MAKKPKYINVPAALTREAVNALRNLSFISKISQSEIIRNAIDIYLSDKAEKIEYKPNKEEKAAERKIFPTKTKKGEKLKGMIIGDPHAVPGVSNERFGWAGEYAAEKEPDFIVFTGDLFDMHSINSYDGRGSRKLEGARIKKDLEAGYDAIERFMAPLRKKRRRWHPKGGIHVTEGNHEDRARRYIDENPVLEGMFPADLFGMESFGWHLHPYRSILNIAGINFSHHFTKSLMGRPISGERAAENILQALHYQSGIAGHEHMLRIATRTSLLGQRVWAIGAGCYFEHDIGYVPLSTQSQYWRGVIMIHEVEQGDFDPMFVSLDYLKERYS